jgi:hypothetical protein
VLPPVPEPPGVLPGRIAPLGVRLLPPVLEPFGVGVAVLGDGALRPACWVSVSALDWAPGMGWVCGVPRLVPDACAWALSCAANTSADDDGRRRLLWRGLHNHGRRRG